MQNTIPTVLVTHLPKEESLLWQAILKLQRLDVVWKPELNNIFDYLTSAPPELLLISIHASKNEGLISGSLCRWCQAHFRNLKIFLVNPDRTEIDELEKRWAVRRGAVDVLPRLTTNNGLVSTNKILSSLGQELHLEVVPLLLQLIENHTPATATPVIEDEILEVEETTAQEVEIADLPPEEFIMYRGVKIPKFSTASRKNKNLMYRGLPVKITQK